MRISDWSSDVCSSDLLLWKVELPHALPTIMAGLTQCIMLSLSMVVIAALVGADGLGKPVVRALNTVNIARGFEDGLAIVIVAILLDRICKQRGAKRSEEHTTELQSLMRNSYAVFCLKKKTQTN